MKTFEYRGFDTGGRVARGLIEALDLKEARERLAARGVLAERLAAAGRPAAGRGRSVFGLEARAMLYRELGALLRAGLPLAHALEILIQAPELSEHRSPLAGIRDRIGEGSALADALSKASPKVSAFERAAIETGERAATLDEVLERLAGFLEEQHRLRDRVQTALIYPAIVFCMAIVVAVLMLGVMIPRLGGLLEETGVPLPALTRVVIALGRWAFPAIVVLLAAAAAGAWALARDLRSGAARRAAWDEKLFRLPLAGPAYATLVNLRFSRTLAMLLEGGIPLVDGVGLAGRATGSPLVSALADAAADEVRHGKALAEAIRGIPPLSGSLPGWIQAGEASGKLDGLLRSASDRFQQQWDKRIGQLLGVLEPALILAVGAFVFLVALAILLPILSLNTGLV